MRAAPSIRPLLCGFSEDCGLFVQPLGVIALPMKLASEQVSQEVRCRVFSLERTEQPVSGCSRGSRRLGNKARSVFEELFQHDGAALWWIPLKLAERID